MDTVSTMSEESAEVLKLVLELLCKELAEKYGYVDNDCTSFFPANYIRRVKEELQPKLLRCPFCGELPDQRWNYTGVLQGFSSYDITCFDCNIKRQGASKEQAIAAWNTRA